MSKKPKAGQQPDSLAAALDTKRKPYKQPELMAWGTIIELTKGTGTQFQDFPGPGGSGPT